ncbi:ATPase [Candidatus Methanomassiliicoccus intestinalis]|nr:ATP-binding protein [Candidatus Methanomassiliicoccus intestinalis]TQS81804.1 MAG: ATPase [Candidatus Methanomassiliicoccus intestinalis]
MIARDEYLQKLIDLRDTDLIKVVTGIRRCGKSTLFKLYQDYLKSNGVSNEQIISINFEDLAYEELLNYRSIYDHVKSRLISEKMNYVFLDEIQAVDQFQKAADSLYIQDNVDLYITGSNASLLSGDLATLLSGRYVEIAMMPLSFKEYVSAQTDKSSISELYSKYRKNSSFPGAIEISSHGKLREYLSGIYNTIVLKDIVARYNIQDVSMLDSIIRFMFDNIGNVCSSRKIAGALASSGRKVSANTVERYLSAMTSSYILYQARRYDLKGKQYLASGEKYYVADIGLRNYLLGDKAADLGHILENIVFLELLRRGNDVYIGKVGNSEVDFIAVGEEGTVYYQVAATVREESTLNRELASLNMIQDHNPKYLLTLDDDPPMFHNGIRQINALDWLLSRPQD